MLTASAVILHAEYRRAFLVIDNEFHFLHGETLMSVKELRDTIDRIWQDTLQAGVDQGAFTLIDQRVVRLALLSMCRGVADWYYAGRRGLGARTCREDFGLALVSSTWNATDS